MKYMYAFRKTISSSPKQHLAFKYGLFPDAM